MDEIVQEPANNENKNLPETFWLLYELLEEFLSICEKHNLPIFLEWGTLIGYMRHRNIIPWDYDGDFSIIGNKQTILDIFEKEKTLNFLIDDAEYNDEGCIVLRHKNNPEIYMDICFFEEKQDLVDSKMSRKTKDECRAVDGYTYIKELFFPLKEVIFLGHHAYIMNNADYFLRREYNDWTIPPKNFENFVQDKFMKSPFIDVTEMKINSIDEILETAKTSKVPFVVRDASFFNVSEEHFANLINNNKGEIYGYEKEFNNRDPERTVVDQKLAWQKFKDRTLVINAVDSKATDTTLLPEKWKNRVEEVLKDEKEEVLSYILTVAPKITEFHTDHFTDEKIESGRWMKLLKGNKIWWMITKEDLFYFFNKGYKMEDFDKITMSKLLRLENNYLFGKVLTVRLKDGDFIWFPDRCAHKVFTIEDSYGFEGYLA